MDRLKIAIALIQEAEAEKKRFEAMEKEIDKIPRDGFYMKRRYEIEARYSPIPRKSVVNDDLKIARRLLALEYM